MLRNKFLLPIIGILSVVFIASFFLITPTYVTDNGDYKHFEDNDLSFDMSESWTVYDYDNVLKTPFLSGSPESIIVNPADSSQFSNYNGSLDDLSSGDEVINTSATNAFDVAIVKTEISKYDSLPDGVTLEDAYKADSLYSLMSSSGKFNLESDSSMTVGDKQAHQFKYVVSYVTYHDTWIEDNGHYIRVLSQASNSVYDNAEPQFDYLISTLNIK